MQSQDNEVDQEIIQNIQRDKKWLYVGVALFTLIVGVVGVIGWGYSKSNNQAPIINNQTGVVNNQIPIINNQTMETNKEIVKPVFAVWNASGISGAAGKMADKLKTQGYEVVETKNAPKEQVGTTVELAAEIENQSENIMKIVGEGVGTSLAASEKYNVRVVIGK